MAEILHRIGIKTVSIETVFKALTTIEGLAGWWTTETFGIADAEGGRNGKRMAGYNNQLGTQTGR